MKLNKLAKLLAVSLMASTSVAAAGVDTLNLPAIDNPAVQPAAKIVAEDLELTSDWDKTFPQDEAVEARKVVFVNRYGITLAADLYKPKNAEGKLPAIAISGPYGAVKEQVSGRYAQELAKRGYLTVAFDPSFYGESGGSARYMSSPDIFTEDFSAAVDYLATSDEVDADKIGLVGICGFGGFGINAVAMDDRIKAGVIVTMYDMSQVTANGYFDADDNKTARAALKHALNEQRTADYKNKVRAASGGVPAVIDENTPQFVIDYHNYYKTEIGYHPRSMGSNNGFNTVAALSFLNMPLLAYAGEIDTPLLLVHGEKAHSRYFSEEAFSKLQGENKELLIIPNANHTDLYYKYEYIPFDYIENFFDVNLQGESKITQPGVVKRTDWSKVEK